MFNSSLRCVARSRPSSTSIPTRPTTPSIAPFTSKAHQRRHSSSKPPIPPNNGSQAIPAASVKQVGGPKTDSKKNSSEPRLSKKKAAKAEPAEEIKDNWAATLPSVPSLQHLNQKDLHVAAFYATYRPISITGPGPRETQLEDFEKLFQPKSKVRSRNSPNEVIYTLSNMVENLGEQIADKQAAQAEDQSVAQKASFLQSLTQNSDNVTHLDGRPQQTIDMKVPGGTVKLIIKEVKNQHRPFNTPPPPQPVSQEELDRMDAELAAEDANEDVLAQRLEAQVTQPDVHPRHVRQRRRILRTRQRRQTENPITTAAAPEPHTQRADVWSKHFFTASPETCTIVPSTTRRRTYKIGHRRRTHATLMPWSLSRKPSMKLISVKRQRRLKMKKHKYKKLMRKTRNLRRRMDKL